MAKLNKSTAGEVAKAATGFEPIEDGVYHAILKDVDATRNGPKGPYWSWEFEIVDENAKGRKQWNNTSLSQAWAFKQTFDAFGVPPDTDTDEIIGKLCKIVVSTRTIQDGPRKGETTNQVDRVQAPDEDRLKEYEKDRKSQADMAEIF